MRDILFLSHRIPYPPDKGDKIRAWHILKHLARQDRVHLCTFIDSPDDIRHVDQLRAVCASVFWRPLSPRFAKFRSLSGLLSGASLTQGYFYDAGFLAGMNNVIARHDPSLFFVFSSAMAGYVAPRPPPRLIIDMVDVDSQKWRQYAEARSGLTRFIYAREGRTLLELERRAARDADAVLFVSRAEAALFTALAPEAGASIHVVGNGVDCDYFDPELTFPNPFGERPAIVFTGVMSYPPNSEAMSWFVSQVMPRLRTRPQPPCLWIVGANPSRAVLALAGPDVRVTERVPDVRPYLAHAAVVVAPMQIGRGIQNKVLEAMAMGAATIVSPAAREGLDCCRNDELITAAGPDEFAEAITRVLDGDAQGTRARARARVIRDYSWRRSLSALDGLIDAIAHRSVPISQPTPKWLAHG